MAFAQALPTSEERKVDAGAGLASSGPSLWWREFGAFGLPHSKAPVSLVDERTPVCLG